MNTIPVKSDKPDGWPRTKDGHLVKLGMTVWYNSFDIITSIYRDDEGGVWVGLVNEFGISEGCAAISDTYAVKPEDPEPSTAESVLRELCTHLRTKRRSITDMMENEDDLLSLISAAEKVLGDLKCKS